MATSGQEGSLAILAFSLSQSLKRWNLPDTAQKGLRWEGDEKSTQTAQFQFMLPLEKIILLCPPPTTKKVLPMFFPVPPISTHFSDTLLAVSTEPCPQSLCRTHQPQRPSHSPYFDPSFNLISAVKSHRSGVLKTHLPSREKVNIQVGSKSRWCLKEIMIIKLQSCRFPRDYSTPAPDL